MSEELKARQDERAAVVAWLRGGGQFPPEKWELAGFKPTLGLRLHAAWISFRRPWAFAQCGQQRAADAIEAGEHITKRSE